MSRRITVITALAVLSLILAGCGGGSILTLLGLIQLGNVVADLSDLIGPGDDPGEVRVLLDGQLLPVQPDASSNLSLTGLTEGRHLLAVIAPDRLHGAVRLIDVTAGAPTDIGSLDPVAGGRVTGTVRAQSTGGAFLAAERVLVVALPGGTGLVDATRTAPLPVPPATTYYAAYTDGNGEFSLDALQPGSFLVTAAVAGYTADVSLVAGLTAGQVVGDVQLDLERDSSAAGSLSGTVGTATQSLPGASLSVALAPGFSPAVPTEVSDEIAQQSGASLMASPWFTWTQLSALTDAGGSYQLRSVPGQWRLTCFAYGYQAGYRDVSVTQDQDTIAEFTLAPL